MWHKICTWFCCALFCYGYYCGFMCCIFLYSSVLLDWYWDNHLSPFSLYDWARSQPCRYHMMTSSNGNIFRVTGHLCGEFTSPGEFPLQRPVTRSFDIFFDLRLNKRLRKQPWSWWFEMVSCPLWRHCNDIPYEWISILFSWLRPCNARPQTEIRPWLHQCQWSHHEGCLWFLMKSPLCSQSEAWCQYLLKLFVHLWPCQWWPIHRPMSSAALHCVFEFGFGNTMRLAPCLASKPETMVAPPFWDNRELVTVPDSKPEQITTNCKLHVYINLGIFCIHTIYRQVSNIRHTLVGSLIVDHSDVVGASPVGAAQTTSSFST